MNTFTRMSQVNMYGENYLIKDVYENGQVLLETILKKEPCIKLMSELQKEHAKGKLTFLSEEEKMAIQTEEDRRRAEMLRIVQMNNPENVKAIVDRIAIVDAMKGLPLTRKPIVLELIEATANKRKMKVPSFPTVARWVQRYNDSGSIGLLPNNYKKGRKADELPIEMEEIFERQEDEYYQFKCKQSHQDVYNAILGKVNTTNIQRQLDGCSALEKPTPYQVRKFLNGLDKYLVLKHKKGVAYANNVFRSTFGIIYEDNFLDCIQLDHTILDVIVVDEKDRIIGRPKLTIGVDVATRLIPGYDLSFDEPSAQAVNNCLLHMVGFKEKQETEEVKIEGDWLTYGIPKNILTDNGQEFHSYDYEKTQSIINTNIKMAPAGKPWPKGIGEIIFRSINRAVIHKLPATTLSNVLDRKGLNPEKFACVTLPKLRALLEKWILDVYHKKPHRGLEKKSPEQVFYEKALDPKLIRMPADMDLLRKSLGHWEKRVLSNKGIEYENLKYNNNTFEFENYRHLNGERFEVDILVDKTNLGSIHVMTKQGGLFKLDEYSKRGYAEGISLSYHKKIQNFSDKELKRSNDDGWIDALHQLDAAILEAQQQSRKAKPQKANGVKKAVQAGVMDERGNPTLTTDGNLAITYNDDDDMDFDVNDIADLPTENTY